MKIKIIKVGYLETNCYILEKNNEVLLVDPGDNGDLILDYLKEKKLLAILITHNHFDHVGALDDILDNYNVDVYGKNNLKEDEYILGSFKFKAIFNPGHTSDSVSYLFDNYLFCGDFIFKNSVGRWDLSTGSYNDLIDSIAKIKKYKDLIIYPGHGERTTLEDERQNNYYFKLECCKKKC